MKTYQLHCAVDIRVTVPNACARKAEGLIEKIQNSNGNSWLADDDFENEIKYLRTRGILSEAVKLSEKKSAGIDLAKAYDLVYLSTCVYELERMRRKGPVVASSESNVRAVVSGLQRSGV